MPRSSGRIGHDHTRVCALLLQANQSIGHFRSGVRRSPGAVEQIAARVVGACQNALIGVVLPAAEGRIAVHVATWIATIADNVPATSLGRVISCSVSRGEWNVGNAQSAARKTKRIARPEHDVPSRRSLATSNRAIVVRSVCSLRPAPHDTLSRFRSLWRHAQPRRKTAQRPRG